MGAEPPFLVPFKTRVVISRQCCTLDPMKTVVFVKQPTRLVDDHSERFVSALDELDLDAARRVPKSDLHNHGALGMRYASLAKIEPKVTPPLPSFGSLKRFLTWTAGEMRRISRDAKTGPRLFQAAVEDAIADGVTVLEMSFDLGIARALGHPDNFARLAADLRDKYADYIRLRPEIGVKKTDDASTGNDYLVALIDCGVFESIDLYGAEIFPLLLGRWKRLYRLAGERGLKLKAHLGEAQSPFGLIFVAERLGLSAIQHGISFARSPRALAWARKRRVPFNVCPASNISLGAVASWEDHPLRKMFDAGLCITIATDDLVAFGLSVSEQFVELRRRGLFTSAELDLIRLMGLGIKKI